MHARPKLMKSAQTPFDKTIYPLALGLNEKMKEQNKVSSWPFNLLDFKNTFVKEPRRT